MILLVVVALSELLQVRFCCVFLGCSYGRSRRPKSLFLLHWLYRWNILRRSDRRRLLMLSFERPEVLLVVRCMIWLDVERLEIWVDVDCDCFERSLCAQAILCEVFVSCPANTQKIVILGSCGILLYIMIHYGAERNVGVLIHMGHWIIPVFILVK